jgi:hypothetical protein
MAPPRPWPALAQSRSTWRPPACAQQAINTFDRREIDFERLAPAKAAEGSTNGVSATSSRS